MSAVPPAASMFLSSPQLPHMIVESSKATLLREEAAVQDPEHQRGWLGDQKVDILRIFGSQREERGDQRDGPALQQTIISGGTSSCYAPR